MLFANIYDNINDILDESDELLRYYYYQNKNLLYKLPNVGSLPKYYQEYKPDNSPVSIADIECEKLIRSRLNELYPEYKIYGEEIENTNHKLSSNNKELSQFEWLIDPIDGTSSFITGKPLFVTMIALCANGKPIFGAISAPATQERWLGDVDAKKALYMAKIDQNQEVFPLAFSETAPNNGKPSLSESILATTSPHYFSREEKPKFDKLSTKCKNTIYGGDGYNYAMLASGKIDLIAEAQLKAYDIMAAIAIINAAGGKCSDWNGDEINFSGNINQKLNIIASLQHNLHYEALELLTKSA